MIGSRYIDETEYPTLYYTLNNLFDKASTFSLYKLQAMDDKIDTYAITESERDFFNVMIKRAARDVFKKISVLSKNITDALQFQSDDLASTSTIDESVSIVYIFETPTYWDDNLTEVLDQKVEEALISYVLKSWFKLKNLKDVAVFEESDYDNILSEIKSIVNHRTSAPKKTYRTL